jgi:hypothetical protein
VGLEQGPLRLVFTIEELLEIKSSGYGQENRDYGCSTPLCSKVGINFADKWRSLGWYS